LQTIYLHESLEGLNSSPAQSDSKLLPGEKLMPLRVAFEGAKFCFHSDMLGSQSRAL